MQTGKPNFINLSQTRLQNLSSTQKNILLMGGLLISAAMLMPNNGHVVPTAQRIPVVLDIENILPKFLNLKSKIKQPLLITLHSLSELSFLVIP
ncbi:hypothetical protein LFREDSHE_18120 [Shewanella baltica]